ncbi:hypothetical protein LN042_23335 [Kitasatospora sp. RB6PN24]|uniref:hypothetical protein n=1 Tax=Kitasatospora humi TaxID=2893891 RepID=UPI001E47631F|nr:hypothetical protein [Kitasatospora humi]MCC9309971.1 hypothetical protein [Kitasatospora humi]
MSTAAQHSAPHDPPMETVPQLRAALGGLASLGIETELDTFEAALGETPLNEFEELGDRYRAYVHRNTSPEAVAGLTMSAAESAAQLRRKMAEAQAEGR